jgi:hypothetical protein
MKPSIVVATAAGLLALALTAPRPAHAAQVFVDLSIGVPAVVVPPRVVYEPVVVYQPRIITPPPVVYYYPHHHHYHRYYGAGFYRSHEIHRAEVPIERRW